MRIVVLGSGVVGVTSAWYLNQAGHEVTVIEREPGPALQTSQCRTDLTWLRGALGRAGRAAESDQMDV